MRFEALPVAVDLPGRLGAEVAAFVESEAGWQVVTPGGGLRPVLELRARPAGDACVVVVEGAPDAVTVHDALAAGALDVVGWPDDRIRLLEAPARIRRRAVAAGGPPVLRVAGCAGGVGTSTVALAIGGLLAWSGKRAVVVGADDLLTLCGLAPWEGPGAHDLAALEPADAAAELPGVARRIAAVPGLSVLGSGGPRGPWDGHPVGQIEGSPGLSHPLGEVVRPHGWLVDAVVVDAGVSRTGQAADLLCARPDAGMRLLVAAAAAVEAPGVPMSVPMALVGDGPVPDRVVARLLGHEPLVRLPSSARVARAGLTGRVPAGLPGRWLTPLRTALQGIAR